MIDDSVCANCEARAVFPRCAACGEIVPLPAEADHYDVLGEPRALEMSTDALQRRYYELSRCLHPDRYSQAAAEQRQASQRMMAAVNLAYRTLRDPMSRARYWLSLRDAPLAARDNRVPPELAERSMAVQDLIGRLRRPQDAIDRESIAARLRETRDELQRFDREIVAAAVAVFGDAENGAVAELETRLRAQTYVAKMIHDIDAGLAA